MKTFNEMADMVSKPSYTAVVLNPADKVKLLQTLSIPEGWEKIAHHMTISMGAAAGGPAVALIGKEFPMTVVSLAQDDRVMAVGVETVVPSTNPIKHITIAVNRQAGGKPFHSNELKNWQPVQHFVINGFVAEVGRGDVLLSPMGDKGTGNQVAQQPDAVSYASRHDRWK